VKIAVSEQSVSISNRVTVSTTVSRTEIVRDSIKSGDQGLPVNLSVRTRGTSLPGYHRGWFVDDAGGRVFVVYGGGPWVSFRTRDGTLFVLGVDHPEQLKSELQSAQLGR
jgi:hypothetical protein